MKDISSALTILSAMITPAVLILASGSLIMTTSQRLSRSLERARKLYEQFETLDEITLGNDFKSKKFFLLKDQMLICSKRAWLLQRIMSTLILALCIFVLTSVSIGIIALTSLEYSWVPTTLGLTGTVILFYTTILLIAETRLALFDVRQEMDYALELSEKIKKHL